jgi:hypothetical protein
MMTIDRFSQAVEEKKWESIDLAVVGGGQLYRSMIKSILKSPAVRKVRAERNAWPTIRIFSGHGLDAIDMSTVCIHNLILLYNPHAFYALYYGL